MKGLTAIVLLFVLVAAPMQAEDEAAAQFKASCANCHNINGDGQTAAGQKMKMPDLRSPAIQGLSDEQLFQTIAYGAQHKQYPHAFLKKGMTEAKVHQLVGHIRSLKKN